ncbi:MAG: phenylalanine--tRNA ligase subunit alpha [Candidatus Babeliaceae bacterium]
MNNLEELLHSITHDYFIELEKAQTMEQLELVRVSYLGRQGKIAALMGLLKNIPAEQKSVFGPLCNKLKQDALNGYTVKQETFLNQEIAQQQQRQEHFDVTAYYPHTQGSLHPYTHIIEEIETIFMSMGFEIATGPEVETDSINFEALNIPKDHPARDMHDTFWFDVPHMLLRTHTSTVQVHAMLNKRPPLALIAPGRCYRHEATDASHDIMFMQCEGLLIDKNISLAHLLSTTKSFLQAIFNKKDLKTRYRPGFFPFVEPGLEIDMSCPFCTHGCSTCKKTGWIEICGAGLIHPNVLQYCNIDPEHYSGFAFGFGLTRLVMLKYGINDIRLLHSAELEFLKQF